MNSPLLDTVRARFAGFETEEIRDRLDAGTLTDEARAIALEELARRGEPLVEPPEVLARRAEDDAKRLAARKDKSTKDVVRGQKELILAVAMHLLAIAAMIAGPSLLPSRAYGVIVLGSSWMLEVAAIVLGLFGLSAIVRGLGWSGLGRVLALMAMFVPGVNVVTLLAVNASATSHLRRQGFEVGLAGASEPGA